MPSFAVAGSQRWLQIAVNRKPDLLVGALRRSGAIGPRISVEWRSPLEAEHFREYRDGAALAKTGIANLKEPLASFGPARGPVWDAIGITSDSRPMFVEAKAHKSAPNAVFISPNISSGVSKDLVPRENARTI